MTGSSSPINWPLIAPLAILGFSVAALANAYTAQYVFGLEPCILCLYQRVPFVVAGALGILGLKTKPGPGLAWVVGLAGAVFLTGAGIAVYHVGVEQHWWVSSCTGTLETGLSMKDFRTSLLVKSMKPCDEDIWTIFGLSVATINIAFSGALALGSFFAARKILDQTKQPQ